VSLSASLIVYIPGTSGTFLFDDKANILGNSLLQADTLGYAELKRAAMSGTSGPLKRPVASLSFALNYYFAGGRFDAKSFKIVNIVIHGINGFLIFIFSGFLFRKILGAEPAGPKRYLSPPAIAAIIALTWLVHPIQLTSVLYPVQRMTSLAMTFTLLCLIAYLHLRQNFSTRSVAWRTGMVLGTVGFFLLAVFTKEIALLIPALILIIEIFCFPDSPLIKLGPMLARNRQLLTIVTLVAIATTYLVILYAQTGYGNRPFSMTERLLTEPRVLFFYLSLILVPRPNAFALHHDDISLSTGILEPWSTLPALLGIVAMIYAAFVSRKKSPMIAFGLIWFLVGHLLESTVFALDLAYEHRNYLPSFGILVAIAGLLKLLLEKHKKSILILAIPVLLISLASLTLQRSSKWANPASMVYFQVNHHPKSARAHAEWAGILESTKQIEEAKRHYRKAADLAPESPAYLIWYQLLVARQGYKPEDSINIEIVKRLDKWGARPTTIVALADISNCILDNCLGVGDSFATWLDTLIAKDRNDRNLSFYYQMKGIFFASKRRPHEAIDAYTHAYNLNRDNVTALISLVWLFISTNQKTAAEHVLMLLQDSRKTSGLPREPEMAMIVQRVKQLK